MPVRAKGQKNRSRDAIHRESYWNDPRNLCCFKCRDAINRVSTFETGKCVVSLDIPTASRVSTFEKGVFLYFYGIMNSESKLVLIKVLHTLVWIFFNIVIFYMLYAVIVDKLDYWLWIGYGLVLLEGLTLLVFKFFCPLTIMARKYSDSTRDNFDIYIPNWLARYNKLIYTSIVGVATVILVIRLLT